MSLFQPMYLLEVSLLVQASCVVQWRLVRISPPPPPPQKKNGGGERGGLFCLFIYVFHSLVPEEDEDEQGDDEYNFVADVRFMLGYIIVFYPLRHTQLLGSLSHIFPKIIISKVSYSHSPLSHFHHLIPLQL